MSDEDLSPEFEVQTLVADYIAIVQQHGPGSDAARRFRSEYPDCPGVDDVDAAYEVTLTEDKRRRVRGCLISFILIFAAGIAALGIIFASKAGWLGEEFETVVSKAEEDVKKKVSKAKEVFTIELSNAKESFTEELKTTESGFTKKLDAVEQDRDEAKKQLATTNAIADELARIGDILRLAPDPPGEPQPPISEGVDLLGDLAGLPRQINGGDAVAVAINLAEPTTDPEGAVIKLQTSDPQALWFRIDDESATSIRVMPGQEELRFEIVAEELSASRAVLLSLRDGEHLHHAPILVAAANPTDGRIKAIILPNEPVTAGARFVASVRLRNDTSDEEIASISLQAEGVEFERQEIRPRSHTLDFSGTVAAVAEPTLVRVTASYREGDNSGDLTSCFLVLPPAGTKSSLASLRVSGQAGEPLRWARVKFAGQRARYPRVVFLKSSDHSVRVPSLVIVKPNKITADFLIRATATGLREVVITASYEGDVKQVKLESGIDREICLPPAASPTVIHQ